MTLHQIPSTRRKPFHETAPVVKTNKSDRLRPDPISDDVTPEPHEALLETHLAMAKRHLERKNFWLVLHQLDRISLNHPLEVRALTLRAETFAALGMWELVAVIAKALCGMSPTDPRWPVWLSAAIRYSRSVEAGLEAIQGEAGRFPGDPAICYHIAKLECARGDVGLARMYLENTFCVAPVYRRCALADADFAPLHAELAIV